ncbi:hypothetical protein AAGW98_02370 [Staphylococcus aureus]|uniref:Uncharacterized protein n=1 Tax=Staphylococcus aureus (strain MRSA252) TaxID=282458 RepID=A0A7U7IDL5_STAAR|nr:MULTISPECIES: hypothetical protein [Staphylococcus]EFU26119.1 hypothetical protein CGSSa00_08735 [Staphylococcus aureus subsp. aureus CGS00]CAG40896.1 hypothetical protein SAR1909 [Staphylococcus aureus subsp. aureus MRSA252]EEV08830.1 conserved hypothetical protein [Staphylococcus aureus subsp. aureus 68-397]MCZ4870833.1 hypothetical protein [Staphylococcus aureus]MDH9842299.1 hypothetical protein [Staphylococcus aureus]
MNCKNLAQAKTMIKPTGIANDTGKSVEEMMCRSSQVNWKIAIN